MKKILLASTALVLSAGLANAQAVSIGGQGRMGIGYTRTEAVAASVSSLTADMIDLLDSYAPGHGYVEGDQATAADALTARNYIDTVLAGDVATAQAQVDADIAANGVADAASLTALADAQDALDAANAAYDASSGHAAVPASSTWAQENRLQFNFAVSVEADHGLTFGAFSRVRITNGSTGVFSGSRVWVEANNLRLTFGNTDGAFRGAGASHGYLGGCAIGYEGGQQCGDSAGLLGVTQGFASTGGGAASRVRVDYSMGDTRVAVSHDRGGATEIGVRTSFDAFTVALGYTNGGSADASSAISAWYNGGSWGAGAIVARVRGVTNYSVSANAELGGGTLGGYVGRVNGDNSWGVNYAYGLGGGASLVVGGERVGGTTTASVGAVFNF